MERLLQLYQPHVVGTLEGFDRLLFRGIQRSICFPAGLEKFLVHYGVLLKHFGGFAQRLTAKVKRHAKEVANRLGRPYVHVTSPAQSKEGLVRELLKDHPIQEGLIAVLACVEPCHSFDVTNNDKTRFLELRYRPRQCTHLYFYYLDRDFGLMHVRLQTWLPFPIQVCVNGREYLARQLTKEGIGFEQHDNCLVRVDNLPRAQELLDRLQTRSWVGLLNRFARRVMPLLLPRAAVSLRPYYWTVRQAEYALDILFKDEATLQATYPQLLNHAWQFLGCRDVLRFLGRRTDCRFRGEVTTNVVQRPEGMRIKHWVEENSIKMYDKLRCVLRIETTINAPTRFRVRRPMTQKGRRQWRGTYLRKGVVDLPRLAAIAKAANRRYAQALAEVQVPFPAPAHRLLDPVSCPLVHRGRPYRGLRPMTATEAKLFQFLLNGRFHLHGFRNADVRRALANAPTQNASAPKRLAGQATRWLRLFRAHGLIDKISHTHCYRVTSKGVRVMTTALKLRETDLQELAA